MPTPTVTVSPVTAASASADALETGLQISFSLNNSADDTVITFMVTDDEPYIPPPLYAPPLSPSHPQPLWFVDTDNTVEWEESDLPDIGFYLDAVGANSDDETVWNGNDSDESRSDNDTLMEDLESIDTQDWTSDDDDWNPTMVTNDGRVILRTERNRQAHASHGNIGEETCHLVEAELDSQDPNMSALFFYREDIWDDDGSEENYDEEETSSVFPTLSDLVAEIKTRVSSAFTVAANGMDFLCRNDDCVDTLDERSSQPMDLERGDRAIDWCWCGCTQSTGHLRATLQQPTHIHSLTPAALIRKKTYPARLEGRHAEKVRAETASLIGVTEHNLQTNLLESFYEVGQEPRFSNFAAPQHPDEFNGLTIVRAENIIPSFTPCMVGLGAQTKGGLLATMLRACNNAHASAVDPRRYREIANDMQETVGAMELRGVFMESRRAAIAFLVNATTDNEAMYEQLKSSLDTERLYHTKKTEVAASINDITIKMLTGMQDCPDNGVDVEPPTPPATMTEVPSASKTKGSRGLTQKEKRERRHNDEPPNTTVATRPSPPAPAGQDTKAILASYRSVPAYLSPSFLPGRNLPPLCPYNLALPQAPEVPELDRSLMRPTTLNTSLLVEFVTEVVRVSMVPRYGCLNRMGVA